MSLEQVADKFVELSGRPDLIHGDGAAMDSWWYINKAQQALDRKLNEGKVAARYAVDIAASQILVPIYGCRAVTRVFCADAETRWELYKVDVQTLRAEYAEPKANLDTDEPEWYTPIWARPYPKTQTSGDVTYNWVLEEILDASKRTSYNALLILPPPNVVHTLDIWGIWYTEKLTAEENVSYWTEEHEGLLINQAMYELEVQYRNMEGAKGWAEAVGVEIKEIIMDQIEEETAEINQMRG